MVLNKCEVIRSPVHADFYRQIMHIRKGHFHDNASDDSYWNGGIQVLLDEEAILKSHESDLTSRFCLITDPNNKLISYARFSINCQIIGNFNLSKIHVVASDKTIIGKKLSFERDGNVMTLTAGKMLFESIISFCREQRTDVLLSEVAVFPYPNLPSLILHRELGFISCANSLKHTKRENGQSNAFIILGKSLSLFDSFPVLDTEALSNL